MNSSTSDVQAVGAGTIIMIILIMITAGILGAVARHILDGQRLKSVMAGVSVDEPFYRVAIPGITAAFVVPLFLSVSESGILKEALAGTDLTKNCFILFSFCLLAAFTARNFLESIAAKALQTANEATTAANDAQSKAKDAEQKAKDAEDKAKDAKTQAQGAATKAEDARTAADDAATAAEEIKDIVSEEGVKPQLAGVAAGPSPAHTAVLRSARSDAEEAVIRAFVNGDFSKRSITGLSRDSGLTKPQVREILANLMNENKVVEITSSKTGSLLYQLKLDE